ncbi:MAG: glycosyltransferase [Chloroflexota bacterium]
MISYHTCPLAILGGKDTGGMNVYVRELTKQLSRMGVVVDVFTRSQDEHVPHVVHSLGYGSRVIHVPAGREIPKSKKELAQYIPEFTNNIKNFANRREIEYDLIHSHYWLSGIAGKALKDEWNIPLIHMFHTLGLMKNEIAGEGEYEGDYRIKGELKVLRNADKIIASTPAELTQLQWLYEVKTDHVSVVPPGVNLKRFYPIPKEDAKEFLDYPKEKRILLFVGRIEPLKGIDTLLRAAACMREMGAMDRNDVTISIIGGEASASEEEMSHEMARLTKISKQLKLDNIVEFLGKRSQDMLPYYYSAADVVVVPSYYESFGLVALEALACGTPVVASRVGGLAYLIEDGVNGFYVENKDEVDLSDKLISLIEDKALNDKMGKNATEYAKGYEWEEITSQMINLYEEQISLVGSKASTRN